MTVPQTQTRSRCLVAATLLLLLSGACTENTVAPLRTTSDPRQVVICTEDPPTCDPPPEPTPANGYRYGLNVGGLINPSSPYPDEKVRYILGLARQAGVRYVREDIYWNTAQPLGAYFDPAWLAEADKYVRAARDSGLEIVWTLVNTPGWMRGNDGDPTHTPDLRYNDPRYPAYPDMWMWYREYVTGLVNRYGNDVKYWAIWNEPNITDANYPVDKAFLRLPAADATGHVDYPSWQDAYTQMWIWAYDPINAHPGLVMLGPELGNTANSAEEMAEFINRNSYRIRPQDIITFHWYGFEQGTDSTTLEGRARAFNSALASLGRNNQIWVTEEGYGGTNDAAFQMRSVTNAYQTFNSTAASRWTALFRYHLWAPSDSFQDWLVEGAMTQSPYVRPAYYCLQALGVGYTLPSGCQ